MNTALPPPGYETTQTIIGCAMKVHTVLGPGYLESVYHQALAIELRRSGLQVEAERPLEVQYDGNLVGTFCADMIVNQAILIELKATQSLLPLHEVQLVNYLTATRIDTGLLLNFGAERLHFKRKSRVYSPSRGTPSPPADFQDQSPNVKTD